MITATLQEAKAKLNQLVEEARKGNQVVLLRGSEIVATIAPLSADDVEISSHLTDSQAEKFWKEVKSEKGQTFKSSAEAVRFLKKK